MRPLSFAFLTMLVCVPLCAVAQDDAMAPEPEASADPLPSPPANESDMIEASTLGNSRSDSEEDNSALASDNAGALQSSSDQSGWVHSSSYSESSSSSTTLTVGDPVADQNSWDSPVRDQKYWEATMAGRWLLQGGSSSCTVTLTSNRWGNSGYRFNGPAGCPGSLIGGVSWALEGSKLVVRGPVSPMATFRERGPHRWEGSDKDGNRLTLTR